MLRRTKQTKLDDGTPIIDLPPRNAELVKARECRRTRVLA